MLISLSGLPGTGKSAVATLAARELGAVYVRIDSIERPMRRAGVEVGGLGYDVAQAVASDNLALGRIVVADCVNPWPLTRDAWRQVGERLSLPVLEIEIVCSDVAEHRRRVESRHAADPSWPSWQDVLDRDYRPWEREHLVIDTAATTVATAAGVAVTAARRPQTHSGRRESDEKRCMPFLNTAGLRIVERLPGWKGRFFHTDTMTFADYEFTAGSIIHEHAHPEEEVYEVIAGELEMFVDNVTQVVRPGIVAIVPSNARHSVRALTNGRVIIVDHPVRPGFA